MPNDTSWKLESNYCLNKDWLYLVVRNKLRGTTPMYYFVMNEVSSCFNISPLGKYGNWSECWKHPIIVYWCTFAVMCTRLVRPWCVNNGRRGYCKRRGAVVKTRNNIKLIITSHYWLLLPSEYEQLNLRSMCHHLLRCAALRSSHSQSRSTLSFLQQLIRLILCTPPAINSLIFKPLCPMKFYSHEVWSLPH